MARMPQIPEPDISNRPGGRVGGVEVPDIRLVEQPLENAAEMFGGMGERLEALQAQRDEATAKLQKAVDGVLVTRMAGDHAEKARNLAGKLQQEHWDTPEKYVGEFQRQLRELTDSEIKAAPSENVALGIAQKYAVVDNQQVTLAHGWMLGRMAQKAKDDLVKLTGAHVRAAQAQVTLPGLQATVDQAVADVQPHLKDLHADPGSVVEKLRHDMAAAWVEANSPHNPKGVSIALDHWQGSPLEKLSAKEREAFQHRAVSDFHGYGERERFQVIKEAADGGAKAYDLFLRGDLDSKNVFQMRQALENKIAAVQANPNLSTDEKKHQADMVGKQLAALRYLDEAARKPGRFDPNFDRERQAKLLDEYFALGKPTDKGPKDLAKIVQLRHDLAEAQANRWISDGQAATMNKALTQMTGKSLAQETKNTGWGLSFLGFGGRTPQQAGNVLLNSYFKGENKAFGKLTAEQQNQARMDYLEQMVDARENGRNVDEKAAEQMALNALKQVAGRPR